MIPFERITDVAVDLPAYRRGQIYRAIFANAYDTWDKATDLPLSVRAGLSKEIPLELDADILHSSDGRTHKALIRLDDGNATETVLMRSKDRNTVCVSTQVGCAIGCVFCVSGKNGFTRNLSVDEIVGQVLLFARLLKAEDARITNIVFMGIGEPLLNYDNLIAAIRFLHRPETLNLGARRFSISTCGITTGIRRLAKETSFEVNLAISLHSAIDEKRAALMPNVGKNSTVILAREAKEYFARTRRKIMIEYVLIKETNTFREDAAALREFIDATMAAYVVNLIPLNAGRGGFESPSRTEVDNFKMFLDEKKIDHIQRFTFGRNIKGACGQLAANAR